MATVQQDNQNNPQGTNNPVNQPPVTAGTSAPAGTAQAGAGSPGSAGVAINQNPVSPVSSNPAPQSNTGYTDVSSYLAANPTGGQQIGNLVANNLTDSYNKTTSAIDNSANQAVSAANTGYTPENTTLINQVASNPTAAVSDPNQVSAFQTQLNDSYTGPTTWSDLGTLQGTVNTAQQNANLLNTPGGSNVLIQNVEQALNPGQVSAGITSLDNLLFSGTPGAFQTASDAAAPFKGLTDYLNSANSNFGNAVSTAQNNASNTSADALAAFTGSNGTLTNLNRDVNAAYKSAQQAQQDQAANQAALQTALNSGTLTPQQLSMLGITPDQYAALMDAQKTANTSLMTSQIAAPVVQPNPNPKQPSGFDPLPPADPRYGYIPNFDEPTATGTVNLKNFLTQAEPGPVQAGTTATADQYAKMAAIQQLLGSKTPGNNALNPQSASLAGKAPTPGSTSFDYTKALSSIQDLIKQEQQTALDKRYQEAVAASGGEGSGTGFGGFINNIFHGFSQGGEVKEPSDVNSYLDNKQKAGK